MIPENGSDPRTGLSRLAMAAPPLPGTLVAITDLLERPESVDVDHVTRIVRHDPIVVARLLKIANSAHYGLQRTVASADRAVDLLGPVTVTGVVMGMGLLRLPSPIEGPAAGSFMRLVRHSMASARFARELMRRVDGSSDLAEVAFTAGLIHDLGRILLVYHEPWRASALFDRDDLLRAEDPEAVLEMEQLGFGYDHTEAGEFVARKFDFPDPLVDAIRYHHQSEAIDPSHPSYAIVTVTACAHLAAASLGFPGIGAVPWEEARSHPIWNRLGILEVEPVQDRLRDLAASVASIVDTMIEWTTEDSASTRGHDRSPRRPGGRTGSPARGMPSGS